MSEVVVTKAQEEYEDDFEKDLDWLIREESRSEDPGPDDVDIEAEIDKELEEEDDKWKGAKRNKRTGHKGEKKRGGGKGDVLEEDEERWPSPMEPLEYDSDGDGPGGKSPTVVVPPPPGMDDEQQTDEEEKKYIQEKIQQANRDLRDQEAPDLTRRRRLHFKEKLVDLVVPPSHGEKAAGEAKDRVEDSEADIEVSGKLSELKLREMNVQSGGCGSAAVESGGGAVKEGRVLVEKDGKFDLVSLKEVESQGLLLPPIANSSSDCSGKIQGSSPTRPRAPRPPAQPRNRNRPSSASHGQRAAGRAGNDGRRRVQSATGTPCHQVTYTLSAQQKELLKRVQERRENLAREAEQRKREEEEQKRQENELAFKAWLMRKRGQLQEERRIHRAQEMERMHSTKDPCDPEESFRQWLHRKQEQQQRERQLEEMRRLEEDSGYLMRSHEECERAFKLWLKQKRAEKQAAQQVARERSRRLVLEERRARRMRDLMCSVNETKPFRFTEQLAYRF